MKQISEAITQLTEQAKELATEPQTTANQYKIQAVTLSITYLTEAAAVLDSMDKILTQYNNGNNKE